MFNIALSIISYDIWFFISHVVLHKYAYPIHKLHHAANADTLRWSDTYIAHPVEDMVQGVGMFFPFVYYTYTITDVVLVLAILNVRGMIRHDVRMAWLTNHHILHHKYMDYNYGEFWIDYLCGTLKDESDSDSDL